MEVHVLTSAGRPGAAESAFATLVGIIRDWREHGRVTTTAGIKPAFVTAMGGVTERELGYETWRKFIDAAVAAGHIHIKQLPTGHTGVLLPGESTEALNAPARRRAQAPAPVGQDGPAEPAGPVRLKPDVWMTFVEWHDGQRRLWDSRTSRAFMYPVNDEARAAWETEPERFAPIEPVSAPTQKQWMREWVSALPREDREPLLEALAPHAPLQAFRHTLEARGLAAAWRGELQKRVAQHVRSWADAHHVVWNDLIDRRPQRPAATAQAAPRRSRLQSGAATSRPSLPEAAGGSSLEIDQLRDLVHRVVDRMSLAELAAIPIRAEHLLGDR